MSGNLGIQRLNITSGSPIGVSTSIIDPEKGALVLDITTPAVYQKTTERGDNSGYALLLGSAVVNVAYAASITPAFAAGSVQKVGTLTNNVTINNPTGTIADQQEITFRFQQDGTGGRTITWGSSFLFGESIPEDSIITDANGIFYIKFRYDSDLGKLVSFAFNQIQ